MSSKKEPKPLDDKCDGCAEKYAYLFSADDGNYCMNCTSVRYGNDTLMKVMGNISVTQADLWQNSITGDELKEFYMYDKYGAERVEGEIAKLITLGITESVKYMSFTSCRDGECSSGVKMQYVDPKSMSNMLISSTQTIIDIRSRDAEDKFYGDPKTISYLKEEVVRQFDGITEGGMWCFHYLAMLYVHFKHTTKSESIVTNHGTTKSYNLKTLKLEKCRWKDSDIDVDIANKIINLCQDIIDIPEVFDGGQTNFNSFNIPYDEEHAFKEITKLMGDYHRRQKHQDDIKKLSTKQYHFIVENDYPLQFDKIKEENITIGACGKCHTIFPMMENINVVDIEVPKELEPVSVVPESQQEEAHVEKIKKIMKSKPQFLAVEKAINLLVELDIKYQSKFDKAKKKGYVKNIPPNPVKFYGGKFSWKLVREKRTKKTDRTYTDVERAIKNLKTHWKFYMRKPDAFFIDLFDSWGLFKLTDPFKQRFFTEFINLRHTVAGRRDLLEALSTGRFDMKFGHYPNGVSSSASVVVNPNKNLYSVDVTNADDKLTFDKLLDDEREAGVHLILSETESLIPMDKDSRAFKLHVRMIIQELWLAVMKNGEKEVTKISTWRKTAKSILANTVVSTFLAEFSLIKLLKEEIMNSDYRGVEPNMMQLYTAFMINAKKGFGNFSSTGSGKTKAVVLGSRVSGARNTLIFTPSPVMDQFGEMILADYPLSYVTVSHKSTDKIFPDTGKKKSFKYHILNYEKIARDESAERLIDEICKTDVDMVIFDEAHLFKQRNDEHISNTRKNLEILLNRLREKKPNIKAVFLTATPIINNLNEGIRLLEMIANKKYPHLKTTNHVRNASRLYMELLEYSLRYKRDYKINMIEKDVPVQVNLPMTWSSEKIRTDTNYSDWEILCTPARIPEIVKIAKKHGKAIVYTEFVDVVVEQLQKGLEEAGLRVGTFTGQKDGKEGLVKRTEVKGETTNPFANGDIDVLIASSPIALGIDGLQKICNCLIFNGLTWTWGKHEQIIGRLKREGQTSENVYLYKVMARIETFDFDQKIKLERLFYKQMLGMCAIDGQIPNIDSWNKHERESKTVNRIFLDTILRDRASRVKTRKQLREAGVTDAN